VLDRVLLIADGDRVTVGNPVIDGARVKAKAEGNGRGDKVVVFKYKSKVRYRRKTGHHQPFTRLVVDKILPPGAEEAKPAAKRRTRKKEVKKDGA
jgi:large subunit ribosomal protein L21